MAMWSAAYARASPGGGVQEAVAQRLRLCLRELAVQGDELEPGQENAGGHGCVEPGLVDLIVVRREMSQAGVLPGANDSRPRRGRGPGGRRRRKCTGRASPSSQPGYSSPTASGATRRPSRTGTAGRRGAAARGGRRPASPSARLSAGPRPGPRAAARSARRRAPPRSSRRDARSAGSGRPHRRGARGPAPCRRLLAGAQCPADGPGDLVAVPGGEPVQFLHQLVAGAGPVAGHHQPAPQRRRQRGDRLAEQSQVIGSRVRPGRARPEHPGQRLARVIAGRQQRMMPVAF
jgi:hypothetical protein